MSNLRHPRIRGYRPREPYPEDVRQHLRRGIEEFRRLLNVAPSRPNPVREPDTSRAIRNAAPAEAFYFNDSLAYAKSAARTGHNSRETASISERFKGRVGRHPNGCACPAHSKTRRVADHQVVS